VRKFLVALLAVAVLGGIAWAWTDYNEQVERVTTSKSSVVTRPATSEPPTPERIVVLGDSYTAGEQASFGWPDVLELPDHELVNLATGGTGYVHTEVAGTTTFGEAAEAELTADTDLLVVVGGRNDQDELPEAVETAAVNLFQAALDAGIEVVAVGPIWDASAPNTGAQAVEAAVQRAAEVSGVQYVDGLQWFRDKPDLIGPDGVHPNDAGQRLLADKMRPIIMSAL
jgi:lysophospholipase L1-like esterase